MARSQVKRRSPPLPAEFASNSNQSESCQTGTVASPDLSSSTRYFQTVLNGQGTFAPGPPGGSSKSSNEPSSKRQSESSVDSDRSSKRSRLGNEDAFARRVRSAKRTRRERNSTTRLLPGNELDDSGIGLSDRKVYHRETSPTKGQYHTLRDEHDNMHHSETNFRGPRRTRETHRYQSRHGRPHSMSYQPRRRNLPPSNDDDGAGCGIREYPDLDKKRVAAPLRRTHARVPNYPSSDPDEPEDNGDGFYEADAEGSQSPERGTAQQESSRSPPHQASSATGEGATANLSSLGQGYGGGGGEHDVSFPYSFAMGRRNGQASAYRDIRAVERRSDERIAGLRRLHELDAARLRQDGEDEANRQWDVGYEAGYNIGHGEGYQAGHARGFGLADSGGTARHHIYDEAIVQALQQQDLLHQQTLVDGRDEARAEGFYEGFELGVAEERGRREESQEAKGKFQEEEWGNGVKGEAQAVEGGRQSEMTKRIQRAYDQGWSDRGERMITDLRGSVREDLTPPYRVGQGD